MKVKLTALLLACIMVIGLASCADEGKSGTQSTAPNTASSGPESSQLTASGGTNTQASTAEPTATPEPAVSTEPEPTQAPKKTLTADELGKPFAADLEGIETVFSDDFSDDDWTQDGIVASFKWKCSVVDGKLLFPVNETGDELIWTHDSYAPVLDAGIFDFQQMELSFEYTWTQTGGDDGVWSALMIGCYISNPTGICDNAGDGLWFGLGSRPQIPVYGITSLDKGGWPDGAAKISTPAGFSETRYIKVVATSDYRVCLWVAESADGEYTLYADFQIEEDQIIIKDGSGNVVNTLENDRDLAMTGGGFTLWTHMAGAIVDNILIRGY